MVADSFINAAKVINCVISRSCLSTRIKTPRECLVSVILS